MGCAGSRAKFAFSCWVARGAAADMKADVTTRRASFERFILPLEVRSGDESLGGKCPTGGVGFESGNVKGCCSLLDKNADWAVVPVDCPSGTCHHHPMPYCLSKGRHFAVKKLRRLGK